MSESEKDVLTFGYYLVAFVDLLGQRDRLRKLEAIPKDEKGLEYSEFVQVVKDSIGAVHALQRMASKYFEAFTENRQHNSLDALPDFRALNSTEIKFQRFSDGLVIYVSLKADEYCSPLKAVYGALAACGSLCLFGLATKNPVRIGVSIGVAAELYNNELYGKAMADAYELESCIAQYPRVVISDEVMNYLLGYANADCAQTDLKCQITKKIASSSLRMLARDFDGRLIVSYLDNFFRDHLLGGADKMIYRNAKSFIDEQLREHQEKQNSKLAFRYALLHGYFSHHLTEEL